MEEQIAIDDRWLKGFFLDLKGKESPAMVAVYRTWGEQDD
jgi:hypothetical protein